MTRGAASGGGVAGQCKVLAFSRLALNSPDSYKIAF